jgi:uncharacterized protein YggU (UPF0235/DUF167 family)
VIPGASRTGIVGWLGGTLKVRVTAVAERGKANTAVEALIADALGVARECVRVTAGRTSPHKTLEIIGLSESEIHRRLQS